jgi:hypothetical protein
MYDIYGFVLFDNLFISFLICGKKKFLLDKYWIIKLLYSVYVRELQVNIACIFPVSPVIE